MMNTRRKQIRDLVARLFDAEPCADELLDYIERGAPALRYYLDRKASGRLLTGSAAFLGFLRSAPEPIFGHLLDRALANLPGVSESFPTRPSVLTGQPKKTAIGEYSGPVRGLRKLSPAPFSTYTPSDVAQEAARLTDAGFKIAFSMPKREKGERTSDLRRRETQFADTFASQAPQLLNHPFYRIADDETKAEALGDLAKLLRRSARMTVPERTIDEIISRAGDRVENRRSRGGR